MASSKPWARAFKTSLAITGFAIISGVLSANMPDESISAKIFGVLAMIPLFPVGTIMDRVFPGPSHDALGPILLIGLTIMCYTLGVWFVLALRQRRSNLHSESDS